MAIYVKPCARHRAKPGVKTTQKRKKKICADCKWIAYSPPSMGRRSLGVFTTREDAERAERDALQLRDRGVDLPPSKATVSDIVAAYLASREAKVGQDTLDTYRSTADHYILAHLGSMLARSLKPMHVSTWYATLLREGGRAYKREPERPRRPLKAKTAWNAFSLLDAALEWGVRSDLLVKNVCKVARGDIARPQKSTARALTDDEVRGVLAEAHGGRWEHFTFVSFGTAVRRGEEIALDWPDIDLDKARMRIAASMSETSKGLVRKGTKSGRERWVDLAPEVIDALKAQRRMQTADRLRADPGAYVEDPALPVFTDELGRRYTPKQATWAFRKLALAAGLTWTRLHSARHSAITTMIAEGEDVVTVAKIAGHSTASTTLGIYAHAVREREQAAVAKLGAHVSRLRQAKKIVG